MNEQGTIKVPSDTYHVTNVAPSANVTPSKVSKPGSLGISMPEPITT